MIRTCKDLCCKFYPDAVRRHVQYWDYLGFRRCHICEFLLEVEKHPDVWRCKCCGTILRTKIKKQASQERLPKQLVIDRKTRKINYYIDYSKVVCVTCNSPKTYVNPKTKIPAWYKKDRDHYQCSKCHQKIYNERNRLKKLEQKKILLLEQEILLIKKK